MKNIPIEAFKQQKLFWIDLGKIYTRKLGLPFPDFEKMTIQQAERYVKDIKKSFPNVDKN